MIKENDLVKIKVKTEKGWELTAGFSQLRLGDKVRFMNNPNINAQKVWLVQSIPEPKGEGFSIKIKQLSERYKGV